MTVHTTTPGTTQTPTTTPHRTPGQTSTPPHATDRTGGPELAHTGAANTGLLAGLAAALVAAGAGLTVLGRRRGDEE